MRVRTKIVLLVIAIAAAGMSGVSAEGGPPIEHELLKITDADRLAPVETSWALEREELSHVQSLRRRYGLRSDQAFVRQLYEQPGIDGAVYESIDNLLFGGIRFTASELPILQLHDVLAYEGRLVTRFVRNLLGAHFAGASIKGAELRVYGSTCEPATILAELHLQDLNPAVLEHTRVIEVPHSLSELNRIATEIGVALRRDGVLVQASWIDVEANLVRFEVGEGELALASNHGVPGATIQVTKYDYHEQVNKDDYYYVGVVGGGMAIRWSASPDAYDCTSTLAARGYFGEFVLTAGHCGQVGQTWEQGGASMGTFSARSREVSYDAGAISTTGSRFSAGRFHRNSTSYWEPITNAFSWDDVVTGIVVCQTGVATTGLTGNLLPTLRCGELTSKYAQKSGSGDDGQPFNYQFGRADYVGKYRDSGALVTFPTIYGHLAIGIHSEGPEGIGPHIFGFTSLLMSAWDLSLAPI